MTPFQSLLLVFAQLVHNQLPALLNFLTSVPGPAGEPALEFVLSKWVAVHNVFYGAYEHKVSIVALAKLLQYGVNTGDARLQGMSVAGDMVVRPGVAEPRRTRSQRAAARVEYTRVPVLVKIFKLIVHDWSDVLREALASSRSGEEEEEEDEADTDDDGEEDEGVGGDEWEDAPEAASNSSGKANRMGVELSKILSEPGACLARRLDDPLKSCSTSLQHGSNAFMCINF